MNIRKHFVAAFGSALLFLSISGCQDSGVPLGYVSGMVTLDGKPIAMATVSFYPESGRASVGKTDAEGNYVLCFSGSEKGAIIGQHRVTITTAYQASSSRVGATYDDSPPGEVKPNAPLAGQSRTELLPEIYTSRKSTELKADVASGSNSIDFDLSS